jgi:hypothetical protein
MKIRTIAVASLALFAALALTGVGSATSHGAKSVTARFSTNAGVARYLVSIGINPTGVVVQRGDRNYAGANCPGSGWNCTSARRVVQISTSIAGLNVVSCTGPGGTASGSGAGTGSLSCTIVQTSTTANNTATCIEQSLVGTPTPVSQSCTITQTSSTGSNTATVLQQLQQGPLCGLTPSLASSQQTQGASQTANVTQSSPSGPGTVSVTQNAAQCAATFTTGSTSQSQTTSQYFKVSQNIVLPDSSNGGSYDCSPYTGTLQTTVSQSQQQYGFAPFASSGSQLQHADLIGHIDQCTTGVATYNATQTENQYLGKNAKVSQTQQGPGHCCSFQGTNPADVCTITQKTSQQGNANAVQTEDLTSEAGTSGNCSGNISATQNGTTNNASSSGKDVAAALQCQSGTCGPIPTAVAWSGDSAGVYHDQAALAGTLTRTDTNSGLAGEYLQLQAAGESCTAGPTDSNGYASCTAVLQDVPAGYTAQATYAGSSTYQNAQSSPVSFVVSKQPTTLAYTGPVGARYDDPVSLTAQLTELDTSNPVDIGTPVDFTLGTQGCTAQPTASGTATCGFTVGLVPGGYQASASFAGNAYYLPSGPATSAFTVAKRETALAVNPTNGDYNDAVTLTGTLTEDPASRTPISGRTVTFTLGSQSCVSAPSNSSGVVSCTIPKITQAPGSVTSVSATFDGTTDLYYKTSSGSAAFTINKEEFVVTYTGQTSGDYTDPTTLKATITDDDGITPIAGRVATLTLGNGDMCSGTTTSTGAVTCSINKLSGPTGQYPISVSLPATDTYYVSGPVAATQPFKVTTEETSLRYTGPTSAKNGTSVTVSAKLSTDDGAVPQPESVTFTLSSGGTCTAATVAGVASCSIAVGSTAGNYTLKTAFAGDSLYYAPSSTSVSFKVTS